MPLPILTLPEIEQLGKELLSQQNIVSTLTSAVAPKLLRIAELAVGDGAFKKFFVYYNDDIIGEYDAERKALSGSYILAPIVEADIVGPASIDPHSRTMPTLPATDVVRIAEFDGGGLGTTDVNEEQHIADQAELEDTLVNGFFSSGGFDPTSALTNTALTSGSTTLEIMDVINPLTIQVDDYLYIQDGSSYAVIHITSVTDLAGGDPPYHFSYGIEFVYPPSGTIAIGAMVKDFTGFSDFERSTKTAGTPGYQLLMNGLVANMQLFVNDRIARLDEELTAIADNQDDDGTAEFTAATTNDNTSKTFLTNYLVSTDISDAGLATLAAERAVRSPQITTRLSQIEANYTGQTDNYYNKRYEYANVRGNTMNGTLRQQLAATASATSLGTYSASAQSAVDAINNILS